jgi:galactose oxidase-like protein
MMSTLVARATGVVASLLLTGLAFAQADWTPRSPTHVPPKRMYAAMAQFGSGASVVMFGGLNLGPPGVFTQFNVLDDTWTWNGTDWTQQSPPFSPPARYGATMAYDPVNGVAILFGGRSAGGQLLSDTWRFVFRCLGKTSCGLGWSQISTTTSPPARSDAAMAFDAALQQVILTGGTNGSSTLNDTWRFDSAANTWTLETPAFQPQAGFYGPARQDTAVASCHSFHFFQGALLFGGFNGSFVSPLGDTWIHDIETKLNVTDIGWFSLSPTPRPAGRLGHAMANYPVSDRAVLYGGQAWSALFNLPAALTDTWNGNCGAFPTWTDAAPAHNPGAKIFHAMTTGPSGLTIVLFGGSSVGFPRLATGPFPNGRDLDETWTWGRQVACVPTDGSELEVGTEVTCLFDAPAGVTFEGWTTEGFAPPHTDKSFTTFHTQAPGEASITAEWTDSTGSHSETLDYTIVRRSHP